MLTISYQCYKLLDTAAKCMQYNNMEIDRIRFTNHIMQK